MLEEIFQTRDLPDLAEAVGSHEFRHAVVLLAGLAVLLGRAGSDEERREVLQSGTEAEMQPIYTVLAFHHKQLTGEQLGWLQEALPAGAVRSGGGAGLEKLGPDTWEEGEQRPDGPEEAAEEGSRTLVPPSGRNRWRRSWRRTTGQIRRPMMMTMIPS